MSGIQVSYESLKEVFDRFDLEGKGYIDASLVPEVISQWYKPSPVEIDTILRGLLAVHGQDFRQWMHALNKVSQPASNNSPSVLASLSAWEIEQVKTDYESVKKTPFTLEDLQQLADYALQTYTPPSNLIDDALSRIVVEDKYVNFETVFNGMGVARMRLPQVYGHLPL